MIFSQTRLILFGIAVAALLSFGGYLYLKGGWDTKSKIANKANEKAVKDYEIERDIKDRVERTPFDGVLSINDRMHRASGE